MHTAHNPPSATLRSETTQVRALVWAAAGYDVAGVMKPLPLSVDALTTALPR